MAPIEFHPSLKLAHVSLVAGSGLLFAVRGAAVQAGAAWAMRRRWRLLSYVIDTLLLAAGAALWWVLGLHPVRDPWLGTKLALLLLYIVLGSLALKRGRTPTVRRASYAAALATYLFIATVAVRHQPLGLLATP
ncbi:MAG TPA: SirB2 family protein [Methylibium sp.]|nr:SirB2 family protein [Methylibium sp.]